MERNKFIRDIPNEPEEEFGRDYSDRIEQMREQIPLIAPELVDIAEKALEEKPECIIFLDKSARLFGTPFMRYLSFRQDGIPKEERYKPKILFFNDDYYKEKKIASGSNVVANVDISFEDDFLQKMAKDMLDPWAGKNIFIVDDCISGGRSLRTIYEFLHYYNGQTDKKINTDYFALSKNDDPSHGDLAYAEYYKRYFERTMALVENDPNFNVHIYDLRQTFLFTKTTLFQNVVDHMFRTKPIGILLSAFDPNTKERITNEMVEAINKMAASYPPSVSAEEATERDIAIIMEYVRIAKIMLLNEMINCHEKRTVQK